MSASCHARAPHGAADEFAAEWRVYAADERLHEDYARRRGEDDTAAMRAPLFCRIFAGAH